MSVNITKLTLIHFSNLILIKIQLDATVRSLIYFAAKSLYMFRVSTAPIISSTKNCNRSPRYRSYCEIQRLTGIN